MIEVLMAAMVLSIGLLGIALTQTRALASNNSSMGRSMAVVASYSILDAMRADRTNATGGSYNSTVTANSCPTTNTTLAQTQLQAWCNELASTLDAASTTTGTISCASTGICTITIQFDDTRIGAGSSSTQQVVTKAIL